MHTEFMEALEASPVIAAVRNDDGLKKCLASESAIVFILFGTICNIGQIVQTIKSAGKMALVHVDLIQGLSSKEIAIDFIDQFTEADGIITTKAPLVKRAKELGLYTVHRFFVIDTMAYESIAKTLRVSRPDCIEILPALMPKIIKEICKTSPTPVIAGGMVTDKEDVMALLQAGVVSISSTNEEIWFL